MDEKDEELKQRILLCQRTGEGREELVAELATRAYRFAGHRRGAGEDEPGEFLLHMYPLLPRLIARYRDVGVPFEHYFNSVLAWNLRSCRRRARGAELEWQAARAPALWPSEGLAAADPEADEEPAPPPPAAQPPAAGPPAAAPLDPAARKRVVLLALRSCWRLGPAQLALAAAIAGVPGAWLAAMAASLRCGLAPRLRRLERLRGRRNAAYARMRLLQERRARGAEGQALLRLDRAIAREAAGWLRACDLIRRIPLEPTHRSIARELGLPRGTVDSSLRAALRRAEGLLQADAIRYA